METDVLILGCGIAGLSCALHLVEKNPLLHITLVAKERVEFSNSFLAQGGIACVSNLNEDHFEKHIQDTMEAGAGLCNESIVRKVVENAPARIADLERWGVQFDRQHNEYSRGKEGGHSENRILHCKDSTGKSVIQKLYQRACAASQISIIQDAYVLELRTDMQQNCTGAYVHVQKLNGFLHIRAKCTLLATGGAGQLFAKTTNAHISSGEGFVLAENVGAKLKDLEFIQFHPTAYYDKKEVNVFLFTEALRGEGAILRNTKGEAFMKKYAPQADLAPRDVVSRAIFQEMQALQSDYVFLDLQPIFENKKEKHFPMILDFCKQKGIEPTHEWIPVSPAMHYMCGGVEVNANGETAVRNLFACGEVAFTGLHGANRLASNSLLEALVFSHFSTDEIVHRIDSLIIPKPSLVVTARFPVFKNPVLVDALLRDLMSKYVSIIRKEKDLTNAIEQLKSACYSLKFEEEENGFNKESDVLFKKIKLAQRIISAALARKESVGGHYIET